LRWWQSRVLNHSLHESLGIIKKFRISVWIHHSFEIEQNQHLWNLSHVLLSIVSLLVSIVWSFQCVGAGPLSSSESSIKAQAHLQQVPAGNSPWRSFAPCRSAPRGCPMHCSASFPCVCVFHPPQDMQGIEFLPWCPRGPPEKFFREFMAPSTCLSQASFLSEAKGNSVFGPFFLVLNKIVVTHFGATATRRSGCEAKSMEFEAAKQLFSNS